MVKYGAGTLVLNDPNNSYSGGVFVSAGVLAVGDLGTLGAITNVMHALDSSTLNLTGPLGTAAQNTHDFVVTGTAHL